MILGPRFIFMVVPVVRKSNQPTVVQGNKQYHDNFSSWTTIELDTRSQWPTSERSEETFGTEDQRRNGRTTRVTFDLKEKRNS